MCNTINYGRSDYQKEPVEGIGWKIFNVSRRGVFSMMAINSPNPYFEPYLTNEWIKFKDPNPETGFCFFLDKEIGMEVLELWKKGFETTNYQLYEIHFKKCLGSMLMSITNVSGHRAGLAREILI